VIHEDTDENISDKVKLAHYLPFLKWSAQQTNGHKVWWQSESPWLTSAGQ
jgi:hypothetical protein